MTTKRLWTALSHEIETPSALPGRDEPGFSKAAFAYESVRRKILDGVYAPGDRLRLTELAHELQLSEMPVREALRLLQKDGLVEMRLHRGAVVASLSLNRGVEITLARLVLERDAALEAVPLHDAESLAALAARFTAVEGSPDRLVEFAHAHRAFCMALIKPCPNAFQQQLIDELWNQVWQATSTAVFHLMRHRVPETIAESRVMLRHAQERSPEGMAEIINTRIANTKLAWGAAIAALKPGDTA
jgi:DNA-binding GntR family transcriptional regulator